MKKTPMNFRFDEELISDLKKIADSENRSLTNLIETELKKLAENHPVLLKKRRKK